MSAKQTQETQFSRDEAVGLWHAVQWMDLCLKQSTDAAPEAIERQQQHLKAAKSALRKVQAARRSARAAKAGAPKFAPHANGCPDSPGICECFSRDRKGGAA